MSDNHSVKVSSSVISGLVVLATTVLFTTNANADGKATYDASCAVCHAAGVAQSPKLSDKAAWKARIAQGMDVLVKHAIEGYQGAGGGYMPAKGGNMALSDKDVEAAVKFMVDEVNK